MNQNFEVIKKCFIGLEFKKRRPDKNIHIHCTTAKVQNLHQYTRFFNSLGLSFITLMFLESLKFLGTAFPDKFFLLEAIRQAV